MARRSSRPADRRRHRHGRRDLARRRREDNWAKLTAGQSGIREITRFATDGLKTRIAGTVDFVPVEPPINAPELSRAARRDGGRGSDRAVRHRHAGRLSRARCSSRVAPVEIEWQQRHEVARASGANDALSYDDLTRAGETGRFDALLRALPVRLGRRPARRELRHQGLADLALDRLRVRRDRDPARRRGDPARRDRRGAVHRHRRLGQRRVADPLLAALGALDLERSAAGRRRSRSPRTATAS